MSQITLTVGKYLLKDRTSHMNHGLYSNAMVFNYISLEFLEGEEQLVLFLGTHMRIAWKRSFFKLYGTHITHLPHRRDFFSHCPSGGTATHIELLLTGVGDIHWHPKPTIFMLRIFIHPKLQSTSFTLSFKHLYSQSLYQEVPQHLKHNKTKTQLTFIHKMASFSSYNLLCWYQYDSKLASSGCSLCNCHMNK